MPMVRVPEKLGFLLILGASLNFLLAAGAAPAPLTLESPEVKAAIERGVKWLETAEDKRWGAKPLVGLVLVKHGCPPEHPKIVEAVREIQQQIHTQGALGPTTDLYGLGISIIFLTALDAEQYHTELLALLDCLRSRQKPHGGWGYPSSHPQHAKTGDTSMTQYAVLALWEVHQSGFNVPTAVVDKVLEWLLCTQDPSGVFGYQGTVASSPSALVTQKDIRHSMVVAGLGSIYVSADLLGIAPRDGQQDNLPAALKEVAKDGSRRGTRIERRFVEAAKERSNEWMKDHYRIEVDYATHYYLYALERYWSFREAAEGISPDDPPWYSDGANYLLQTQKPDGCWFGEFGSTAKGASVPDTCFSLLFLLRSMKKSIEQDRSYGRGLLVGGRGLPKGTAAVQLRGGQIVARPLAGPAQGLMAALENVGSTEYDQAVAALGDLAADEARQLVSQNEAKLREMVTGDSSEARLVAIQTLAKSDNLDAVPTLIYALSDPDPSVVVAADDGLRRMSRRFQGVGLPEEFTEPQRAEAIHQWKEWYLTIQPDAEFEN